MADRVAVLDHGYVQLVEAWGSDERIVEAARMSTNKGFQGWGPVHEAKCGLGGDADANFGAATSGRPPECSCTPKAGDEKLLRYLYTHKHMTPFEMAGLVVEVQAPIFVFREWHRHRTQSYNELSARYTPVPDVNYLPTADRLLADGGGNRQAQGVRGARLDPVYADAWLGDVGRLYAQAQDLYATGLAMGLPKELARLVLPVGRYSRMRASANLRNWLGFLALRLDAAAQWEIRQYAAAVDGLIAALFPRTHALFAEGR